MNLSEENIHLSKALNHQIRDKNRQLRRISHLETENDYLGNKIGSADSPSKNLRLTYQMRGEEIDFSAICLYLRIFGFSLKIFIEISNFAFISLLGLIKANIQRVNNRFMKPLAALIILLACLVLVNSQNSHLRRQPFEITHDQAFSSSRGSRSSGMGGAIVGFFLGPILFILSFIVIYNNQKKAAIDHRRIKLAQSVVTEVNPFNVEQMRAANGKLVHVTGDTLCNETVGDRESGITMNGVVKLLRNVQVKEMRQHESNNTRRLEPVWASSNQPSPGGGYTNDPGAWFIGTTTHTANNVTIGNYLLSQTLKTSLPCNQTYTPTMEHAYNIARNSQGRVKSQPEIQDGYIFFPATPGQPESLGTLRVKYTFCRTGQTSILSQSSRNTFTPFRIDIQQNGKPDDESLIQNTNCCCLLSNCTAQLLAPIKQIDFISQHKESTSQMIKREQEQIDFKKTLIRIISYFLMVFSICAFFGPITALIGYVPLLGGFLSNVIGLAIFIAALIICIPLFLLAMSISWLIFHPKVGLIILGIGLVITGAVIAVINLNKPKDSPDQATQTAQHLLFAMRSFLGQAD